MLEWKESSKLKVVKERLNEIVDFALTESPYKKTSQGWINESIYFQLWPAKKKSLKEEEELVNISVHSAQIFKLIIFGIAFIPTILAFALFTFF
tara:strand:- start:136 stop:417 length:282 start_codon:yes stop_codon:yes gene_type:complete